VAEGGSGGMIQAEASTARPWETKRPASAPKGNVIDRLGKVREQIKALEADEKQMVEIVRQLGEGEHLGDRCKAVITVVESSRLDTAAIREALPEAMIEKFTKTSRAVKVTIKPNI
jgi:hypothetical protein